MGDACEMLVAAEMTFAGVPAMKMPDNWPGYDVIAQPKGGGATPPLAFTPPNCDTLLHCFCP